MKRVFSFLLCFLLLTGCGRTVGEQKQDGPQKLQIVTTIFPAYDFVRAVVGDLAEVTLLLPPGTESHSYEPTPADILKVQDCDLFFYLGGETDSWVDTILTAVEPKGETMRMVDCVPLLEEADLEGVEDHDHDHDDHDDHDHGHDGLGTVTGMDEHVWTSPRNAAVIVRAVGDQLAALDAANGAAYQANAEAYAARIDELDAEFEAFFDRLDDDTIVFGDRFPLLYFAERYDLDYYAAFPGCSTQTEPSAATIAFLTEKVKEEKIPTVWYIEFSNHLVADSIAEAAGVGTAMFHTCHNVSQAEIDDGATYLSLMKTNLETLQNSMR